ncbi:hypothetical protein EWM64_g10656 [Hericium alpestre]|uniref:Uncharacterized protein n=1 Tax=Hericium alpestre TaxID=135208 RepID=A0A4Y9ZEZ7_9AGAM|nr:hypothetical protein EWM64_g10656 [Hericium alpestre]
MDYKARSRFTMESERCCFETMTLVSPSLRLYSLDEQRSGLSTLSHHNTQAVETVMGFLSILSAFRSKEDSASSAEETGTHRVSAWCAVALRRALTRTKAPKETNDFEIPVVEDPAANVLPTSEKPIVCSSNLAKHSHRRAASIRSMADIPGATPPVAKPTLPQLLTALDQSVMQPPRVSKSVKKLSTPHWKCHIMQPLKEVDEDVVEEEEEEMPLVMPSVNASPSSVLKKRGGMTVLGFINEDEEEADGEEHTASEDEGDADDSFSGSSEDSFEGDLDAVYYPESPMADSAVGSARPRVYDQDCDSSEELDNSPSIRRRTSMHAFRRPLIRKMHMLPTKRLPSPSWLTSSDSSSPSPGPSFSGSSESSPATFETGLEDEDSREDLIAMRANMSGRESRLGHVSSHSPGPSPYDEDED